MVRVSADEAGRRLDNFLLTRLKSVPRSRVYRMIRGGEVRINGRRCKPDMRLQAGDEVRIPPFRPGREAASSAPARDQVAWLAEHVLFEDRDLLVLNKPAGLAVHGGSGVSFGAIELLRAAREHPDDLELVHRLDRDTSGCLLVAKRRPVLRALHAQFRDGEVRKEYLALLCGRTKAGDRFVDDPLVTHHRRGGERHVAVDPEGKPARTRISPRERYRDFTLADIVIETGRTHQIRVHSAHIGYPVAGDERYGTSASMKLSQRIGLRRLFLHAAALSFDHPRTDRVLRVEAPLDADLARILEKLPRA